MQKTFLPGQAQLYVAHYSKPTRYTVQRKLNKNAQYKDVLIYLLLSK